MAEQFDHRDLIITLCQKGSVPIGIRPENTGAYLQHIVEVNLRGKDGNWHQAEIPLVEFYALMFQKVFPAAARRMHAILAKPKT
jgi:hypothetical protein